MRSYDYDGEVLAITDGSAVEAKELVVSAESDYGETRFWLGWAVFGIIIGTLIALGSVAGAAFINDDLIYGIWIGILLMFGFFFLGVATAVEHDPIDKRRTINAAKRELGRVAQQGEQ